ncbi:hypothetical protein B0A50_02662 [Salinomyces thailandicus]|uniref:Uncharacterized protein n=1 Tax=Salinomyces thailandicus TaxID=706561 RepID=A0A4U0U874_9PEZI|nr:hypothetical protein B0A50_02662 [Salinomyces thailandica]
MRVNSAELLQPRNTAHTPIITLKSNSTPHLNVFTDLTITIIDKTPPAKQSNRTQTPTQAIPKTMTDTMPLPSNTHDSLPRNDSFSTNDIHEAFKASATKPRNNLSLRVVKQDETAPPPPSPLHSRPVSAFGHGPSHRR